MSHKLLESVIFLHSLPFKSIQSSILRCHSNISTLTNHHQPMYIATVNFLHQKNKTVIRLYNSKDFPSATIATHLGSCSNLSELNQIHAKIIRTHQFFLGPNRFYWNSVMRCYVRFSYPNTALKVYYCMSNSGIFPDYYTLPIAFKAVCQIFEIRFGLQLHSVAIINGLVRDEYCESGIINMYVKVGDFKNARKVFDENSKRKLGSWNAMICGLAQSGYPKEALDMFIDLQRSGFQPDDVTVVSVASACGSLGDLKLGMQIHKCAIQVKNSIKSDILLSNSLIDMYAKCGRMDLASMAFNEASERNVSTWTSMIMGLAMHGNEHHALTFFNRMVESGVQPNHVTFVGVLSACAHGGMVNEGMRYFYDMMDVYSITPALPHYGCVVDMLGRAARLEEARKIVERMPMKANSIIWGTLLGHCENGGSVEMGEWVAKNLVELEPWNDGVYVVLSNIYARAGQWEDVNRVRKLMSDLRVQKTQAYSSATTLR